jgi:glutamate synthase domain-containing protein 3
MPGGVVVVLGETGRNFGAGMSGGIAYVYDEDGDFSQRYNPGMVQIEPVRPGIDEELLRTMVERHLHRTGSARAAWLLENWSSSLRRFHRVVPHPSTEEKTAKEQDVSSMETAALEALLREEPAVATVVAH